MKVTHNIALAVDQGISQAFADIGVSLKEGFSSFKMDESDPRWNEIEALVQKFNAVDTTTTIFTAKELRESQALRMVPIWHHLYPEPAHDAGYLEETFDLSDFCRECGVGLRQVNDFLVSTEPKWGSRHLLQLNWVFDEYFVKIDAWRDILDEFNIGYRQVRKWRSSNPLETVVQLTIPELDVGLDLSGLQSEECSKCGRTKYEPATKGYFPSMDKLPDQPIFKPAPWFGSGANGHKAVVVSNKLFQEINDRRLKGARFLAIAT